MREEAAAEHPLAHLVDRGAHDGLVIAGNLLVHGSIHHVKSPIGLSLYILGSLRAQNVSLSGLELVVRDSVDVKEAFIGSGPHGGARLDGGVAAKLREILAQDGPDAIAFYISGQLLTEDYYAVNKLAKGFIGTNNVDSNSRLCMSSAVAGYTGAFGSDGPPPAYADLAQADCLLLLGSNTAACHPIVWSRIRDRQAEGAKVIVADPRATPTATAAGRGHCGPCSTARAPCRSPRLSRSPTAPSSTGS